MAEQVYNGKCLSYKMTDYVYNSKYLICSCKIYIKYNIFSGFWFSPEFEYSKYCIDRSQENVTGQVQLKLYKGKGKDTFRCFSLPSID